MRDYWLLMGPASLASMVMSPVHCLFGLHIVRRGVIFIDLAVAQIAALGMVVAIRQGHDAHSPQAYWWSLGFALAGALAIALTKYRLGRVPHEAMIGIFFVVASAGGIIALENTPHGLEELKDLLAGSILFVDNAHVANTAVIYGTILAVMILFWKATTRISLQTPDAPTGLKAALYDFLFYSLLAFVVASSVKIAGVLVVFTWLVMPAVMAFLWVSSMRAAVLVSLPLAVLVSLGGLWASYKWDWPTGAAMVVVFGAVVALFYVVGLFVPNRAAMNPEDGELAGTQAG